MKPEQERFAAAAQSSGIGGVSRRRFMEGAALVGAMTSLGDSAWAQAPSAAAGDSRLPDGTEFPRWEQPLSFSKTYYVDNTAPNASDAGPGDRARPFRTISKAAQILQPGERVVIAA